MDYTLNINLKTKNYMKKFLFACIAVFTIAVSYKLYASTIGNEINVAEGCEDDPRIECRGWIIYPDGRPPVPVKEKGINKMSIDEPEIQ